MPTILITGCSSGIGLDAARYLHARGWSVIATCRRAEDLAARRAEGMQSLHLDLADEASVADCVARALALGPVDALVNNASSYFRTPLASVTPAQFDDLIGSNLRAPLFLAQACAAFEELQAIINILDVHARRPRAGFAPYLAAKAGLWTLTEALALELAPRVRVNGVAPGHMIWAVQSALSADEQAAEAARIPLQRLGGAVEIARAVAFLLSRESAYMTGAVLPVDGGLRIS